MKERPIIFSGEMIRAILEGRKTQTRRVIKPQPPEGHWWAKTEGDMQLAAKYYPGEQGRSGCPYGPGDRLYVRETWQNCRDCGYIIYRASANERGTICPHCDASIELCWKSPIHMFKDYARIWLEVVSVRAERLQEISEADAMAEGCDDIVLGGGLSGKPRSAKAWFRDLWDFLHVKTGYTWDKNKWVWAVEFDVAAAKRTDGADDRGATAGESV